MYTAKPGAAAQPLPGIDVAIYDWEGNEVPVNISGQLVIRRPWPGMLKKLFGKKDTIREMYCSQFPGVFNTGDRARRDEDGDFWIVGRLDDAVNVCGHRLDTVEIESALLRHPSVVEAAVVGMPHPVKGEVVYAYVTINDGYQRTPELLEELRHHVRGEVGPIACPSTIQYATALPKTRSGKIIRRILRKIALNELDDFGDLSTLADPSVIHDLIEGKQLGVK
jgi:acetyl-CoA synthetase